MSEQTSLENNIVAALLKDRKLDRRWRNIRLFALLAVLITYAVLIFSPSRPDMVSDFGDKPYVSLIRMQGIIMPNSEFSAERVIPLLNKAFADKKAKGVMLLINSPGGSPVQASIIHDKIMFLKKKYQKKVVIEGGDMLTSGAYLIATAGDKIYTHNDTLTGSIGVVLSSFGFSDAMDKIGVKRRVYTAGNNKDRLDPFRPETPEDIAKIKTTLEQVHQHFIHYVMQSREKKLRQDNQHIFSGDFWTGEQAAQLGLVDGTANTWEVLQKEFAVEHYRAYSPKPSLFQAIFKDVGTLLHFSLQSQGVTLREQAPY